MFKEVNAASLPIVGGSTPVLLKCARGGQGAGGSEEKWSGGSGLTDRQAQRHKEIVPESFFALEKVKDVNALSLPISGGSTPLLRRAGSEGGA